MGTGLLSAIFGPLLKLLEPFLEHVIPRLYRPQYASGAWRVSFSVYSLARDINLNTMKASEVLDVIVEDDLEADFHYSFEVEFRSYPGIGLRDLTVVFVFQNGDREEHQPWDPHANAPLKRLNLPARRLVSQAVNGTFRIQRDKARRLQGCESVKFRGRLLTRAAFEWTVTEGPMEVLVGAA